MAKRKPIITESSNESAEPNTTSTTATVETAPVELVVSHDSLASSSTSAAKPEAIPEAEICQPQSPQASPSPSGPAEANKPKVEYQAQGIRGDYIAGVRLLEDRRFKQMQLAFKDKPSEAVRQAVHEAGFQWRPQGKVWTIQIDPEKAWQTRAKAESMFEKVAAMIRTEMGVSQEVG